jgi:glycolate oxidase iron-sulfur subunit
MTIAPEHGPASPTPAARWLEGLNDCVHCGFCLPACPTYDLWGQEMDSPRGRIWLMRSVAEGAAVDATFVRHMDACLGCMACVTACPSGVRYGSLLETARSAIEDARERGLGERLLRSLLFFVMPRPGRLRLAARAAWWLQKLGLRRLLHATGLARRLPRRLRALEALLPRRAPARRAGSHRATPEGEPRLAVGLLAGCVQSVWFGDVNAAAERVLVAEGCAVAVPAAQCCGALELHGGREGAARDRARALIAAFEAQGDLDAVAVAAAGCGSAMKDYGRLLADDPQWAGRAQVFAAKVADVTELLSRLEPRAPRRGIALRVAYQDACHLAHGQGVRAEPRALLAAIPGIDLVELPDAGTCCGSAGIYNVLEPETADQLGARKADLVRDAAPDVLATANPGCALQLARHLGPGVRVAHPIELVDESIHGI